MRTRRNDHAGRNGNGFDHGAHLAPPGPRCAPVRAFVLKLWPEQRGDDQLPHWRGSIRELGAARLRYFDRIDGVVRFLVETTGASSLLRGDRPEA
jgi:hypothetical protein